MSIKRNGVYKQGNSNRDREYDLGKLRQNIFIVVPIVSVITCLKTMIACREKARLGCREVQGPCENNVRCPLIP